MSNNILLTKFTLNYKGMLSEKDSQNIGDCFIPAEVENCCINSNLFSEAMVCEEDSDSTYRIFYISDDNLEKVFTIIVGSIEENCRLIVESELSKKRIYEIHNNNYFLYKLRNLIQMKKERFITNSEILLIYEGEVNKGESDNA